MRSRVSLSLGTLGMLALLGCSGSDDGHGPSSSYLVNAIAVADIDANGQSDILGLVSTDSGGAPTQGYVSTRLQGPSNSFAMPTRFGVGREPANLVVSDLNADGRPDLVVVNTHDRSVSVRLADPARPGFFLPATVLPTPGGIPLDVAVGDANGDGLVDIVVAAYPEVTAAVVPPPPPVVTVFRQVVPTVPTPNQVTFGPATTHVIGGQPQAVTVADLDGNGFADIAVATTANTVSVLLQTSAGAFASAVDYTTGVQPVAIKAVDINGDGKPDLLTANYGAALGPDSLGLSVLLQGTGGAFLAPVHHTTGFRSAALAVGDLNGDGKVDVAVANAGLPGDPGSVSVLLQDAATPGALLAPTNYLGAWGPMGVAFGDMDGDGRPDLVLADGDIVVRFNNPASPGTFGPRQYFYN